MRPTLSVDLKDSLEVAARKLRENGCGILPVTEEGFYTGAITEATLSGALAAGMELTDPVESISRGVLTAKPSSTGADALRLFETQSALALIVLDEAGRVLGVVTPSDLYPKRIPPPRPPLVGGMATPFGVYLTTGTLRAGVGHLALITTGFTLFGLFLFGMVVAYLLSYWLGMRGVSGNVRTAVEGVVPFLLFLVGMRSLPLSGIHAAEHKVVHAIERGEDLVPSTVRRMPRVHPRCGTNLAVGATLFTTLGTMNLMPSPEWAQPQLLVAGIMTLILWRPLGNAMQFYVTTKRPTEKQLAMGIRSGRELLDKYSKDAGATANFGMRILNSGMLHVIAGSVIAGEITHLIIQAFNLPIPL